MTQNCFQMKITILDIYTLRNNGVTFVIVFHPQFFLKGDYRIRPLPSREQWGQLRNFRNIKRDFEYLHWPTLKP
jgi:hypothetical protein